MKKYMLFGLTVFIFAITQASTFQPILDRKLTEKEKTELLPLYVASVEAHIDTLPSPEDEQLFQYSVLSASDFSVSLFKDNNIVGQRYVSVTSKIEDIKSVISELEKVTVESRRLSTSSALAGFKNSKNISKIICKLGYLNKSSAALKIKTERVVKCTDDRSVSGKESIDGEGFMDLREIILSIDAVNLKPLSPLKINHFIAG